MTDVINTGYPLPKRNGNNTKIGKYYNSKIKTRNKFVLKKNYTLIISNQ